MQVIGHLGQDAQLNDANGKRVINFSIAHTEKFKNAEGIEVNKTIWVSCSHWTERTNIVQYLRKGTQCYVEGIPDIKMYRGNDGTNRANITLRVQSIQLLGSKQSENTVTRDTNPPISQEPGYKAMDDIEDDGLPF